ncbi:MAG TPA: hypothetical protein VMF86_13675 [Stellaceae bacterium]|nr:hypothetical protein [Stellaceae bacterium]
MAGGEQSYVRAMLASVSPASYLAMISGQSDWGIFPLLLDFSISKDLGTPCAAVFLWRPRVT